LNLSTRRQQNDTSSQLGMRGGKHAGHTIAEVISGHVNGTQLQGLDHARHIVRHRLKRHALARTGAFA
jgi:hypothetical protein